MHAKTCLRDPAATAAAQIFTALSADSKMHSECERFAELGIGNGPPRQSIENRIAKQEAYEEVRPRKISAVRTCIGIEHFSTRCPYPY